MHLGYLRKAYRYLLKRIRELKIHWKLYLFQSFLATLVLFIIALTLSIENAVVIASIASTAFIVFTQPSSPPAVPRRIFWGHVLGFCIGCLVNLIPHQYMLTDALVYALAVGLCIFLMMIMDLKHAPAAGTALGVAITGFSPGVLIAVVTSALVLSMAQSRMKGFLKDLA
ncbi:MAG: HPP family protein [Dehalococcoides mccartyi]|uniref:HPP family protein n=2 Tax=Dehalococcoides mccartyi TaxID=61435 RepID=A0AB38ZA28_9CHLR|nr:HPP family protein [Dehalococcoides mccartyi]AII59644.1 hypothetical protein X793_04775 [Dehalococcoides mccartyi CG4]AAW39753.1 membrane protein, putative [Dehalococcoides mccartyi 195]MBF4483074.1 HPP family protein [Dehalococcoides mccartyi]MBJ7531926.1 HPP family protein [Dehalococcoides mccartyi]MDN4185490.1 HPP family protein [Dehalococcoides mccartyi]